MPLVLKTSASRRSAMGNAWRGLAIVLLAGAGTAAVIAPRHGSAGSVRAAVQQVVATPEVAPLALAAPRAMPPAQVPTGRIAVVGDRIEIDIHALPLGKAARLLAVATQTPLDGIDALRDATQQVTLKWQGRSATDAWQQLMSDGASYVARCAEHICSVRVLGLLPASVERPAAARAVAEAGSALHSTQGAIASADIGMTTEATHTTTATAPPPSIDPPGLFPSDD